MSNWPTNHTTGLMQELRELWSDEHCGVSIRFEDNGCDPWCLMLTWVQEYGNLHGADWCEFTWQFYGENIEECAIEAIDWCRGLLPFEACHACDGQGWYNSAPSVRTQCDECDGMGLANRHLVAAGGQHD